MEEFYEIIRKKTKADFRLLVEKQKSEMTKWRNQQNTYF